MNWIRKTQESVDEQMVAIGMIVSDVLLAKMQNIFNPDFFINDSLRTICLWCMKYYKKYEIAPKQHIQDIYDEHKFVIDKAKAELINEFLGMLSKRFIDFEEPVNDDYFINRTLKYFTKRALIVQNQKTSMLLELDKVDEAEEEIVKYKKFCVDISPAENPLQEEVLRKVFAVKDIPLFQFPGALGEMIGPIERGFLVGILGIFKRGKSTFMLNVATLAASCKLKVVIVSLEMQSTKVAEKLLRNIGTFTKEKDKLFPCFDCYKNQTGECNREERASEVSLLREGQKPLEREFDSVIGYVPCVYCKENNPREFIVETWFERIEYPDITFQGALKSAKSFEMMYGDNIRLITYPRFTANIKDIERDLFLLEEKEMFIPDLIIIDYAGILKPEDSHEERRNQIDTTWKRLAQLASERNCAVFTATQGTRAAIKKKNIDSTDVAEWIGIIGHVDIMLTLNQTASEKENKVLRLGVIAHRHEDYNENQNVLMLTNFGAAQAFSDSYLIRVNDND